MKRSRQGQQKKDSNGGLLSTGRAGALKRRPIGQERGEVGGDEKRERKRDTDTRDEEEETKECEGTTEEKPKVSTMAEQANPQDCSETEEESEVWLGTEWWMPPETPLQPSEELW
ncbi:hypothetical protein NDU88_000227 [Pleurodeles waltl]|uniref:Uncharacterized protein n=1 Tax=Pleurodeles waltl TaxID=8319 RepID=A0AAV7VXS5_PLEWA|nr:hypothetical protein NDU88_000227 [Pleurodeles waltl]